jgi:phosphatidylglycerophosphate synthase
MGAMLDVAADFVVILGMFVVFTAEGFYPVWLLGLVVFGFAQFVFSSCLANRLYDPVGKYYGTVLYGAVVLTLLFPIMGVFWFVAVVLSVFTAVSVSSRVAYLFGFLHQ